MTLSITIAELRAAHACDLDDRIAALSAHLGRTPDDDEPVPLAKWAEVTPRVDDLFWAMRRCWWRGGREIGVEVACRAAERAMTHVRPQDVPVLRAAVDAARGCVAGMVTVEACRDAAHAANAAAYAAYAAYAYTATAYAATAAAATAAYAADAYTGDAYTDTAATAAAHAAYGAAADADPDADPDAACTAERAAQRADLISLLEAT